MGKKSSPAPDYTPLANASKEAAQIMAGLGQDQLDFAKQQYADNAPLLQQIAKQQQAAQDQQMQQAKDYYDYQVNTFRPVEKGLVADAMAYDTDAMRNRLATKAAADAGLAFNQTRAANERAMASMGVNPNSGRFAGLQGQSALQQAAARAGAMTGARERADQLGYARKLDAAGLGRGLAGASTAAYGGATGAGTAAGNSYQSAGQNYMAGMGAGASTIGSGLNMQISGLSNVLNNQTKMAMQQDSTLGELGGLLGGAASAYTAFSDERLKHNIEKVGVDKETGLNLYKFNYIWSSDKTFIGVMAQEVIKKFPEAVYKVGDYFGVKYDKLGLRMMEVA